MPPPDGCYKKCLLNGEGVKNTIQICKLHFMIFKLPVLYLKLDRIQRCQEFLELKSDEYLT